MGYLFYCQRSLSAVASQEVVPRIASRGRAGWPAVGLTPDSSSSSVRFLLSPAHLGGELVRVNLVHVS